MPILYPYSYLGLFHKGLKYETKVELNKDNNADFLQYIWTIVFHESLIHLCQKHVIGYNQDAKLFMHHVHSFVATKSKYAH